MQEYKRILIYRIGNLGDIICSIPAMVAVRKRFPNAWIGLLTNKETKDIPSPEKILTGNDFLDEIITYEPKKIKNLLYLYNLGKKIYNLKIDLLIYLSLSDGTYKRLIRDKLFFYLTGCKKLIGFKKPKPIRFSYLKDGTKIPIYPQEVERLMSLLTPLSINPKKIEFRLPIKEKDKLKIDKIWKDYGLTFNKNPIIAISPAGKFPVKHWDVKNYAKVAQILQKKFNVKIILIGGKNDKQSAEEIIKAVGDSAINLVGMTTYMESAEVLKRCNLLISNDCGPAHLAAAVGTPVIGIYSSRNFPESWHPWGNIHTILRNDTLPCRFCLKTECKTMECIKSITVEQVIEACEKYLISSKINKIVIKK